MSQLREEIHATLGPVAWLDDDDMDRVLQDNDTRIAWAELKRRLALIQEARLRGPVTRGLGRTNPYRGRSPADLDFSMKAEIEELTDTIQNVRTKFSLQYAADVLDEWSPNHGASWMRNPKPLWILDYLTIQNAIRPFMDALNESIRLQPSRLNRLRLELDPSEAMRRVHCASMDEVRPTLDALNRVFYYEASRTLEGREENPDWRLYSNE